MDVSPANGINQIDKHKYYTKKTDPNLNCESQSCVVVNKYDDDSVPEKRKRGRPKKISNNIIHNTSIMSNTGNQDPV